MWLLGSHWRARRAIAAVISLLMLLVTLAVHTTPEFANLRDAAITHVHDQETRNEVSTSHQLMHHDHHAEMAVDGGFDLKEAKASYAFAARGERVGNIQVALDRPPQAAQC